MPIYTNTSANTVNTGDAIFQPNETRTLQFYVYHPSITMTNAEPYPEVISNSGSISLATGETVEIILNDEIRCMNDFIVQILSGSVKLYYNTTDNKAIEFTGVYQDQVSSRFVQKIIVEAKEDSTVGSYFVKNLE